MSEPEMSPAEMSPEEWHEARIEAIRAAPAAVLELLKDASKNLRSPVDQVRKRTADAIDTFLGRPLAPDRPFDGSRMAAEARQSPPYAEF